jgi:hypothetical protein
MRREKSKSETKKGRQQQTPQKFRESSNITLKTCILLNWKTLNKWTNF